MKRISHLIFLLGIIGGMLSMLVYGADIGGGGITGIPTTGSGATGQLTTSLCGIIGAISEVIGVFALLMFVLGGTLYALAHFLPAAGNLKGSMQGWGMGMLMGGIIALILYILAPFIIGEIIAIGNPTTLGSISTGSNAGTPGIGSAICPGGPSLNLPGFPH